MSHIIGFLENAGRNAAMRYAAGEQLLRIMECEEIPTERAVLDSLLGVRETMYCMVFAKMREPAKKKPEKKKLEKK